MAIFGRKPNEKIKYKYKLNKNYKPKEGSISVNGFIFRVGDSWTTFDENQYNTFRKYIKSHENPKGILDEYIYDPLKEIKMKENSDAIKYIHRKKIYSVDELSVMTRKEIEDIAKEYLIETKGKVNKFLIQCILKEQKAYRSKVSSSEDFFDDNNKIPNA